jgi:hypothetical protein
MRETREILVEVCQNLRRLVEMMRLDSGCQWTYGFENAFENALLLSKSECSREEIIEFAHAVEALYQGGMGSFNDYAPSIYQRDTGKSLPIPGAEEFETVQGKVYELTFMLRIIESK